jgi:hypothetical protein
MSRTRQTTSVENWDDEDLFDQLRSWQEEGKFPVLHSVARNQWSLVIDTEAWHNQSINERSDHMAMRFVTPPQDTPQNAIRAALKHLR